MKKSKNNKNKIVFDDEIVTKDSPTVRKETKVEEISKKVRLNSDVTLHSENLDVVNKKRKKKKKTNQTNNNSPNDKNNEETNLSEHSDDNKNDSESNTHPEIASNNDLNTPKEESIRARKRRKHMELLQAKKLRSELNLQQKCLNYLSMWKHSRSQWKFEKLKQVWLQQNMFDDVKMPDEFWDTLMEYFNNAKGQAKSNILNEAIKVVESVQNEEEESPEKTNVKYVRARSIVQNLQD